MIGKAPGLPDPLFRQSANPLPRNETGYTFMRHTSQETGTCKFTGRSILFNALQAFRQTQTT
jgi:hypothetical protein